MTDVTQVLINWPEATHEQRNDVVSALYAEMKRSAAGMLVGENKGLAMQPTILVHEAYVRLVNVNAISWNGRRHFLRVATRVMRRVLVDEARRMRAQKRDHGLQTHLTGDVLDAESGRVLDALELDEAMNALEAVDPIYAELVEARVFGGLTIDEAAQLMALSPATVKRKWKSARAWLFAHLDESDTDSD